MKSRIAAALFAFFLGGFGAHKFYLGKIGLGFLYLFFCWTLVPGIIAFIEFVMYLCMSDEEFNEKYNDDNQVKPSVKAYLDAASAIEKYKALLDKGVISSEEFEIKKAQLLK